MQIERLRLHGFKSFVDGADLTIDPGLTGIVGPNGCGKSNLAEALRWVMGEASARRLRDSVEVFLKCFISLRDGYQAFTEQMLGTDRNDQEDRVAMAKDAKELGMVLLTPAGGPEAPFRARSPPLRRRA